MWTRPPLHFSGFAVLGMNFLTFFSYLVFPKHDFYTPLQVYDETVNLKNGTFCASLSCV